MARSAGYASDAATTVGEEGKGPDATGPKADAPSGTAAARRAAPRAATAEEKTARAKAAAAKRRQDQRAKVKAAAAKAATRKAKAVASAAAKAAIAANTAKRGTEAGARKTNTWTQGVKLAFFGELALTANVRRSAQVAGMNEASAYRKKRKDADFAKSWGIALAEGYSRIELMLLERALANADEAEGGTGASSLSDRVLMTLYTQHRQSVREVREAAAKQGGGTPPKIVRARLEAKLAQMHARIAGRD